MSTKPMGSKDPTFLKKFGMKRDSQRKTFGSKGHSGAGMSKPVIRHQHSMEKGRMMSAGPVREMHRSVEQHKKASTMGLEKLPGSVSDAFEAMDIHSVRGAQRNFMTSMNN